MKFNLKLNFMDIYRQKISLFDNNLPILGKLLSISHLIGGIFSEKYPHRGYFFDGRTAPSGLLCVYLAQLCCATYVIHVRTPTSYVHYELSLKAERIIDVPRMPYGHAVLSVRTALRAVLIWDGR